MQTEALTSSGFMTRKRTGRRRTVNWLTMFSLLICTFLTFPVLTIIFPLLTPDPEAWGLLWETRLPMLLWNTVRLGVGVGLGTFLLGTTLAWAVATYDFPGKRFFEWSLLLPLSMPGYVIGFVYIASFEYGSIVPTLMEKIPGVTPWYPDIRGATAVIVLMSFVLYPYVYLMSKSAFRDQYQSLNEAARSLGTDRKWLFIKVAIPVARPAILAGVSLAVMESLADFGTVGVFSYDTFTTAIYEVWFGLFDRRVASQLAGLLLLFVLVVLWFERMMKSRSRYYQLKGVNRVHTPRQPKGLLRFLLVLYPTLVLIVAFAFPCSVLLYWSVSSSELLFSPEILEMMRNTMMMGVTAGLVVIGISILLAYGRRLDPGRLLKGMTNLATTGYAVPGSVIAVGVLIPLAVLDTGLNRLAETYLGISVGLIFTGTVAGLVFAYVSRFITVGFNAITANLERISPSLDMVARSLGKTKFGVIRHVHLNLLRSGMITGFIMVCMEVMKEMPATLLLRPFGFETLATRIWQLSSESLVEEAALPSLLIVLVGLVPVILLTQLNRKLHQSEPTGANHD